MIKYGILFLPTKEWISFYDNENNKEILFSDNLDKVKSAIFDILYTDGGYDGDSNDFSIKTKDVDKNFDGKDLVTDKSVFVDSDVVDKAIYK